MKQIALLAFATGTLLTGCNLTPPFDAFLDVNNVDLADKDWNATSSLCVGGLRATLNVGDVTAESPIVPVDETSRINYIMPLPVGALITIEAWCYGEDDAEIGYSKVSRRYTNTNLLNINVIPPQTPDVGTAWCVPVVETRGNAICTESSMFD